MAAHPPGRPGSGIPTKTAVSAGGVVVRGGAEPGTVDVLVLTSKEGRVRHLPKGTVEDGESAEAAATREVREEGGVVAEVLAALPTIDYWFFWRPEATRYHKYVHFFLMRYLSGDVADHDDEVEAAEWMPAAAALGSLTYPKERHALRRALAELEERKGRDMVDGTPEGLEKGGS